MLSVKWRLYNLKYYYNYYKGKLDGIEGPLAKQAYTQFQKDYGLKVDGIYGKETDTRIVSIIKDIQRKLNQYGHYGLMVDGEYGNKTINAVKDFQKKNGLVADGYYGKNTHAKFQEIFNKPKENLYMTDEDWKKSKYFKKSEFKCPCGKCNGYGNGIYKALIDDMNKTREHFGKPIMISSGYRCLSYNNSLRGSIPNSPHVKGQACDFYISGYTSNQNNRIGVRDYMKTLPNFKHTYCNVNGSYPNMGNAIHYNV